MLQIISWSILSKGYVWLNDKQETCMVGWLIYSEQDVEKNKRYIEFYREEGKLQDIIINLILVEKLEFGIRNNSWFLSYNQEEIKYPDFVICRTIYPLLSKQLEYMGIIVFNNSQVAEICNDKAKTYQYVAKLGIQIVDSIFYKNSMVKQALNSRKAPSVIKAVAGHGGNQVFLINPPHSTTVELAKSTDFNKVYEMLDKSDVVLQPLIGTKHQDLRVYIIGHEIIAAVLRTAKEGFKSNYSLGGEVREYKLSVEEIKIVDRIVNNFEFGLVGIDFIIGDKGELIFNEIEDVVGARMLYQCTNINLVRLYLNYIKFACKREKA